MGPDLFPVRFITGFSVRGKKADKAVGPLPSRGTAGARAGKRSGNVRGKSRFPRSGKVSSKHKPVQPGRGMCGARTGSSWGKCSIAPYGEPTLTTGFNHSRRVSSLGDVWGTLGQLYRFPVRIPHKVPRTKCLKSQANAPFSPRERLGFPRACPKLAIGLPRTGKAPICWLG